MTVLPSHALLAWSALHPYGINSFIVLQPSFQAQSNTASTTRFSCCDSGCFRNRGCRDHKLSDGAPPVKSIGNRLGRDSVAAGSVVSSTRKVPLRCIVILFEATAIHSFLFVETISLKPRCSLAILQGLGSQSQKSIVFVGVPVESKAASDAFIRPAEKRQPCQNNCRCPYSIGGGGALCKSC